MKTLSRFGVGFALTLVAILLPRAVLAGSVFHFHGQFADAYFDSLDSANCVDTSVFVFAQNGKSQSPPGPGDLGATIELFISKYDYCAQAQLLAASFFGPLPLSDFSIDKNLNSAQLTTTLSVSDAISAHLLQCLWV